MTYRDWLPSLWSETRDDEDRPLMSLRKQFDALFEDLDRGVVGRTAGFAVRSNVSETDKEVAVTAELPGVEPRDVEVSVSANRLTIRGDKKSETEQKRDDKDRQFHRIERSSGSFQRTVSLPFEIDADAVRAEFRNGVLTVTVLKPAEVIEKTRKIEVRQAA